MLSPSGYEDKLTQFQNLEELSIHSDVSMDVVGATLKQLPSLKKLKLLNVVYKSFPQFISEMGELEYLYLRGCDFNLVPESLSNLKNLNFLAIENTEIETIPESLSQLKNLRHLSLRANWKLKLSPDILPPNLKVLEIPLQALTKEDIELLRKKHPTLKLL